MKQKAVLMVACVALAVGLASGPAFGQVQEERETVGIGIEFGSNFITDTRGNTGASTSFLIDFAFTESLRAGLYREEVDFRDPDATLAANNINLSALQVTHTIHEMLESGVRFGSADTVWTAAGPNPGQAAVVPYAGLFGTITPFASEGEVFRGALNLNLGYDFLPDANMDDLFKAGLSARISF